MLHVDRASLSLPQGLLACKGAALIDGCAVSVNHSAVNAGTVTWRQDGRTAASGCQPLDGHAQARAERARSAFAAGARAQVLDLPNGGWVLWNDQPHMRKKFAKAKRNQERQLREVERLNSQLGDAGVF